MAKGRARQQEKKPTKKAAKTDGRKRIGSDEVMQETFMRHFRAYQRADGVLDEAKTELNSICEKAKAEGVTKRSLKFALNLKKDEGVKKAKAERDEQMRVATWLGFAKQLEMFAEELGDPIWEEGKRAAMANEACSPPPHHSQKAAQRWTHGWHHGMKIVNNNRVEALSSQFKPLGDTVAAIAEKAGIPASLPAPAPEAGEQPAHH